MRKSIAYESRDSKKKNTREERSRSRDSCLSAGRMLPVPPFPEAEITRLRGAEHNRDIGAEMIGRSEEWSGISSGCIATVRSFSRGSRVSFTCIHDGSGIYIVLT